MGSARQARIACEIPFSQEIYKKAVWQGEAASGLLLWSRGRRSGACGQPFEGCPHVPRRAGLSTAGVRGCGGAGVRGCGGAGVIAGGEEYDGCPSFAICYVAWVVIRSKV